MTPFDLCVTSQLQQQESDQCQLQIDELTAELRAIHGDSLSINEATQARDRERRRYVTMVTNCVTMVTIVCNHGNNSLSINEATQARDREHRRYITM